MTRSKDDNMTHRQDDKSYQMLPKISKTAKKTSCQKLANIAKLCQMLPNDANRYLKWSTTKTQILQQVVKRNANSFKPLANIGTI